MELTEVALKSACLLGKRLSIIAISRRISAWYGEWLQANGLIDRLASSGVGHRPSGRLSWGVIVQSISADQ